MTELEGLIRFWQATRDGAWFLLDASVLVHIDNTIKHLKELQVKQEENHDTTKSCRNNG